MRLIHRRAPPCVHQTTSRSPQDIFRIPYTAGATGYAFRIRIYVGVLSVQRFC